MCVCSRMRVNESASWMRSALQVLEVVTSLALNIEAGDATFHTLLSPAWKPCTHGHGHNADTHQYTDTPSTYAHTYTHIHTYTDKDTHALCVCACVCVRRCWHRRDVLRRPQHQCRARHRSTALRRVGLAVAANNRVLPHCRYIHAQRSRERSREVEGEVERERQRERDRERNRERQRQRERDTHTQTQTDREREIEFVGACARVRVKEKKTAVTLVGDVRLVDTCSRRDFSSLVTPS